MSDIGTHTSGASFGERDATGESPWRYRLWRYVDGADDLRQVTFIMLNPSTADALKDDPTVRRCLGFARSWGYGRLAVVNLFALRATNPHHLTNPNVCPIGPENDGHILTEARDADLVVAAWGARGNFMGRAGFVLAMLRRNGIDVHCIRRTKHGHPEHPLYLPSALTPSMYQERGE